jgi:hypothetical protein
MVQWRLSEEKGASTAFIFVYFGLCAFRFDLIFISAVNFVLINENHKVKIALTLQFSGMFKWSLIILASYKKANLCNFIESILLSSGLIEIFKIVQRKLIKFEPFVTPYMGEYPELIIRVKMQWYAFVNLKLRVSYAKILKTPNLESVLPRE